MPSNKEWWHTDAQGRRIGYMTPERLQTILAGFYSDKFPVKHFSDDFGISEPSIYRWLDGTTPIRKDVAMLVSMLPSFGTRARLPQIDASHLPKIEGKKELRHKAARKPHQQSNKTQRVKV